MGRVEPDAQGTSQQEYRLQVALLSSVLYFAAPTPAKITALVGDRLIVGWGGTSVNNRVVLVDGERVKAVGTVDSLPVPADAQTIDCHFLEDPAPAGLQVIRD